ncbi:unnamed protein product [Allacma fusca]|uniref:Uncharacterized protein n=1 Tax=Allacma fusca TaxID=39272 RepID=A0A8J2PW64_9HEXA|nr:unnamed protein product [Allacma fusca]
MMTFEEEDLYDEMIHRGNVVSFLSGNIILAQEGKIHSTGAESMHGVSFVDIDCALGLPLPAALAGIRSLVFVHRAVNVFQRNTLQQPRSSSNRDRVCLFMRIRGSVFSGTNDSTQNLELPKPEHFTNVCYSNLPFIQKPPSSTCTLLLPTNSHSLFVWEFIPSCKTSSNLVCTEDSQPARSKRRPDEPMRANS